MNEEVPKRIDAYAEKVKKEMDAERAEQKRRRDSDPILLLNRQISENNRLIEEMGLMPGVKVFIKTAKMRGEIAKIRPNSRVPVLVIREDGETFPYSPLEVEIIK